MVGIHPVVWAPNPNKQTNKQADRALFLCIDIAIAKIPLIHYSIELFEGSAQSNSTVFSSLSPSAPLSPLVERQSFILGGSTSHVGALRDTITEKGITSKTVLLATATGSVFSVPRVLLDPRYVDL